MKIIVDEMPYFHGECPFMDKEGGCPFEGGAHCEHYDISAKYRGEQRECSGLITLDEYMKQRENDVQKT